MNDTLELNEPVGTGDEEGTQTAPPPFESVKWRIKIADKEYGPYPRSRLIDFLKEGRVQAGTFIACGTDVDFHRADPTLTFAGTSRARRNASSAIRASTPAKRKFPSATTSSPPACSPAMTASSACFASPAR